MNQHTKPGKSANLVGRCKVELAERSVQGRCKIEPVERSARQDGPKPMKPPYPGSDAVWKKYDDEGTIWWYYKGPLGEWWMSEHTNWVVERYEFESGEE